jgi:hypothetical protein
MVINIPDLEAGLKAALPFYGLEKPNCRYLFLYSVGFFAVLKPVVSPTNLYPIEIISGCDIVFISQVKNFPT